MSKKLSQSSIVESQYTTLHDVYVLLDAGDKSIYQAFDLTRQQYDVLNQLHPTNGQRLTTLSRYLLFSKSQITRLVDQLEQLGFVERATDPQDGRAQRVKLTTSGYQRQQQVRYAHLNSLYERFNILNFAEQQQLTLLLKKLRDGLDHHLTHQPEW